jgi:hypothetical protein
MEQLIVIQVAKFTLFGLSNLSWGKRVEILFQDKLRDVIKKASLREAFLIIYEPITG